MSNNASAALSQSTHQANEYSVLNTLRSPKRLRTELFAGIAVALALIPEAISFSILAGVDPQVGLFTSFTMAVTIAFVGGRRAMISAATGAVALVVAPVVADHGLDYLIATVLLAGVLQVVFSLAGAAKLMRFLPRSVMVGFVNALAIVIFTAQIPELIDVPAIVYPLVAIGLLILVFLPRLSQVVPAPLVVIVLLTIAAVAMGIDVPTVGDQGNLPNSLPSFFQPDVPFTLDTLQIIFPYAFAMALVGLLESLMTAKLVDDITDTHSDKTREGWGQGVANIVTGLFGGMGGCAMIGQTMINVKTSGARTRISTFAAGVFLLFLVVGLGDVVERIPMAALVAVMIMVSVGTMDWHSVHPRTLRRMPLSATTIMLTTVVVTVVTHNLAYGVIFGVIVAMIFFVRRVAHFAEVVDIAHSDENTRVYAVKGLLFFASSNDLYMQFDYLNDPHNIIIDLTQSQIYDSSTVAALDAIVFKYRNKGKNVEIVGLNDASAKWLTLSGNLGTGH
ncbi:MAG: SulP family inorganic anion transporter [Ilumatobacteraceae bacterium]|jgi:sulfate permease, SulP family|nr:MAG: sulfate permease [Acidimicrobiia bacterium BACL6 MAG-120322-bin79]